MKGDALFSPCGVWRYLLERHELRGPLFPQAKVATFVMLNPSTADAETNDPTVRRCIGFAQREECDTLYVVNLFGLRSTDPAALLEHHEPVGVLNDEAIARACRLADVVVFAWGAHPAAASGPFTRGRYVVDMLRAQGTRPVCLGTTAEGWPRHPLYVRADTELVPWAPPC